MPINLAALLFNPKAWAGLGVVLLLVFAVIQTKRLEHAKADQWDRGACVKGQPCEPVKWKAEVAELRPALARASADLGTCRTNEATLSAGVEAQNRAMAALEAAGRGSTALATAAVQAQRSATQSANQRASQVLAARAGADACTSADALILGSLP